MITESFSFMGRGNFGAPRVIVLRAIYKPTTETSLLTAHEVGK
jgi:hypothetical protein